MSKGWAYHIWDDVDNSRIIGEHFPHYAAQYEAIPFGVAKADIARYVYMYAFGGVYMDTDYKLLRPLDDVILEKRCVIPLEGADPHDGPATIDYPGLGNAIIASEAAHPFWPPFIEHIFEVGRPESLRDKNHIIRTTGPEAVTRFYLARAGEFPDISLPAKNYFYPTLSWMATRTTADHKSYGAHLHWGSWRNVPVSVAARNLIRRKLNGFLS
jgi:mannosyltransferase OCH1-like enzyme